MKRPEGMDYETYKVLRKQAKQRDKQLQSSVYWKTSEMGTLNYEKIVRKLHERQRRSTP